MNRVVITGLGVFSAAGKAVPEFWETVREGRSVIGPLTIIDTSQLHIKIGAEIKDFDPKPQFPPKQLALLDRFSQLAVMASREAIADAGVSFEGEDAERSACLIGSGVGGQQTLDEAYYRIYAEGRKGVHPFTIPRLMLNAACSHVCMEHGIKGPAFAVASACSSSTHAIGLAFHMVRSGMVHTAVTGGTDFHGDNKPGISLGTGMNGNVSVPRSVLEDLRAGKPQPYASAATFRTRQAM